MDGLNAPPHMPVASHISTEIENHRVKILKVSMVPPGDSGGWMLATETSEVVEKGHTNVARKRSKYQLVNQSGWRPSYLAVESNEKGSWNLYDQWTPKVRENTCGCVVGYKGTSL